VNGAQTATGRFIAFEGCDGSGKTTLARLTYEALCRRGVPAIFIGKRDSLVANEPLQARIDRLRQILWDYPRDEPVGEWGDDHWFHLLLAWFSLIDRTRIQPLVAAGHWVLVDGWIEKYVARFALKEDFDGARLRIAFAHLSVPEVVYLDVPPEITFSRIAVVKATESGALDGHAGDARTGFIDYQTKVGASLAARASERGWFRLDASQPEQAVLEAALASLLQRTPAVAP
jgi:dTMP kinase